jgi:hypothetical protein
MVAIHLQGLYKEIPTEALEQIQNAQISGATDQSIVCANKKPTLHNVASDTVKSIHL